MQREGTMAVRCCKDIPGQSLAGKIFSRGTFPRFSKYMSICSKGVSCPFSRNRCPQIAATGQYLCGPGRTLLASRNGVYTAIGCHHGLPTTLGKPSELHRSPFLEQKDIQPHLLHLNSLVYRGPRATRRRSVDFSSAFAVP